mmetsp:Transcript_54808/g.87575  ORF Transcript_54808/g.87575 Transcript_54808/m.87575 type:complete len:110 (-) Transcript_54808:36-365(-)|eukprot:CAMPEP_0197036820 /NCGR_PEP_ID=MMETSP1384-20130603/14205_1 /TAXON_ID=29189 /ORGANISM="Ammonia sp." /LENGTH=109 /DNA_ID=CAMNT_0042467037 /DNA_START=33 /DNA_END=362 /DNA_ORIENTATION=+
MAEQKMDPNQLLQAMQLQVASQIGEMLSKKITEKCFHTCLNKMHSSLKSSEQKCVNRCTERWWEASQIIQTTLLGKADEQVGSMDENMIGFDSSSLSDSSMKDDWFTSK